MIPFRIPVIRSLFILLPAFAISLSSQSATAQESSVLRQLLSKVETYNGLGFDLQEFQTDALNESETKEYVFTLEDGYEYSIVAVCDDDCDDVDACLYDENSNEIECDEEVDDFPIVEVTPKWSGLFTLDVDMYSCSVEPCNVGYAIFRRES